MKKLRTVPEKRKLVIHYRKIKPFHCLLTMYAVLILAGLSIRFYGTTAAYVLLLIFCVAIASLYYAFSYHFRNTNP